MKGHPLPLGKTSSKGKVQRDENRAYLDTSL